MVCLSGLDSVDDSNVFGRRFADFALDIATGHTGVEVKAAVFYRLTDQLTKPENEFVAESCHVGIVDRVGRQPCHQAHKHIAQLVDVPD